MRLFCLGEARLLLAEVVESSVLYRTLPALAGHLPEGTLKQPLSNPGL